LSKLLWNHELHNFDNFDDVMMQTVVTKRTTA
jgi:hypothetical protein